MKQYFLSDRAEIDLDEIHDFISEDNPTAADEFLRTVDQECDQIVAFPRIGSERKYLGPGIRCLPFGNYLILYRIVGEDVQVLRVVSGYRDIESLF